MAIYTSDVDLIYDEIQVGKLEYGMIRILTSSRPQSLRILEDFPNITEIFCPIICPIDKISNLSELILARLNLVRATFMIFIPSSSSPERSSKKQRLLISNSNDKYLDIITSKTDGLPSLIRRLSSRIRYMNLDFQIINEDTSIFTFIMLKKGILCMNTNLGLKNIMASLLGSGESENKIDLMISGENNIAEPIFQTLVATDNLHGLITFGDATYNLSSLDPFQTIYETAILTRNFNDEYPLQTAYLQQLVSKSEIINIIFTAETFHHCEYYSQILKDGTIGNIKRIKGIVPISHVQSHIDLNLELEEIHIYVTSAADIQLLESIIKKYDHRPLAYYVHYSQLSDEQYWLQLQGSADIIFENIVKTLMPI